MAEVRLISTSIVKLANLHSESVERIELTPWDLQFLLLGPIQKGLLFLKPTPSEEKQLLANTIVDHLKLSFSRTLHFFPLLAGRLVITKNDDDDDTSSFFLHCNNAGAHFIHSVADNVTVSDIIDPVYVPRIVHSFFPLNGVSNYQSISSSIPLLAVQVTELVDGFFVGCTMNHAVADGSSFWQFFNSWSEISRGFNDISRPPVLDRWFPRDVDCPIRIPFCSDQLGDDDEFVLPVFEERIFHFTKEKIAELKAKANAETNTTAISSLQALLAHLWRSVVRNQRSTESDNNQEEEVKYILLVSARPRLRPSLPEGYFGNTIQVETLCTTAVELLEKGLGWAAWQMNKLIALQTNDGVRKFYEGWVKNPNLLKLSVVTNKALGTSSSPRFNVYGNDLGWGRPVAVRSGGANKKSNGKITLFPGVEDGSIDIELAFSPETLIALGNDEEFMDAVTI